MAHVVISLDFEMRWGVHDIYGCNFNTYRQEVMNLRAVIPQTLDFLAERNLRATWATVGAIGLEGWDEYFNFAPAPPAYRNKNLAIDPRYADLDPRGELHFAPDLIGKIIERPGQELGSHSFSHVYFREPGVTENDFILEMLAVKKIFNDRFNIAPVSFVFPRNQSAFENLMSQMGLHIWRGNELAWFYDRTTQSTNSRLPRILRLAESISPWVRRASPIEKGITRSSLFVRFNLPKPLWALHLDRIKNELRSILPNHVFHIWWHPENLGLNMGECLNRLKQLLDLVGDACATGNVDSENMAGLTKLTAYPKKEVGY